MFYGPAAMVKIAYDDTKAQSTKSLFGATLSQM